MAPRNGTNQMTSSVCAGVGESRGDEPSGETPRQSVSESEYKFKKLDQGGRVASGDKCRCTHVGEVAEHIEGLPMQSISIVSAVGQGALGLAHVSSQVPNVGQIGAPAASNHAPHYGRANESPFGMGNNFGGANPGGAAPCDPCSPCGACGMQTANVGRGRNCRRPYRADGVCVQPHRNI